MNGAAFTLDEGPTASHTGPTRSRRLDYGIAAPGTSAQNVLHADGVGNHVAVGVIMCSPNALTLTWPQMQVAVAFPVVPSLLLSGRHPPRGG